MKYKVGDRVKVQSLERYNKYKNRSGDINYGCETEILFTSEMSSFCGQVVTITRVRYIGGVRFYYLSEDKGVYLWGAGMFEGLVEEESKAGTALNPIELKSNANCITQERVDALATKIDKELPSGNQNAWELPDGYQFVDENGNVINAQKIVLEKKKKEYPKTYEECCKVLGIDALGHNVDGYKWEILAAFQNAIICRDAYWKIAGEEMGLGKPWEPDWNNISDKYCIYFVSGDLWSKECQTRQCPFAFPTSEMRDAFKENFGPDIEKSKELL